MGHLWFPGTPVVRWHRKDQTEVLSTQHCPCGITVMVHINHGGSLRLETVSSIVHAEGRCCLGAYWWHEVGLIVSVYPDFTWNTDVPIVWPGSRTCTLITGVGRIYLFLLISSWIPITALMFQRVQWFAEVITLMLCMIIYICTPYILVADHILHFTMQLGLVLPLAFPLRVVTESLHMATEAELFFVICWLDSWGQQNSIPQ